MAGAYLDDDKGLDSGSAYVFRYVDGQWIQEAKLIASDGAASDQFGQNLSISADGNTVLIGSPFRDEGAVNTGAAYVFSCSGNTWSQTAKLTASDAEASDLFGGSVSISADGPYCSDRLQ